MNVLQSSLEQTAVEWKAIRVCNIQVLLTDLKRFAFNTELVNVSLNLYVRCHCCVFYFFKFSKFIICSEPKASKIYWVSLENIANLYKLVAEDNIKNQSARSAEMLNFE